MKTKINGSDPKTTGEVLQCLREARDGNLNECRRLAQAGVIPPGWKEEVCNFCGGAIATSPDGKFTLHIGECG